MISIVLTVVSLLLLVLISAGSATALIFLWSQSRAYQGSLEQAQAQGALLSAEAAAARAHLMDIAEALKVERKALADFQTKPVVALLSPEQIAVIIKELKLERTRDDLKDLSN